MKIEPPFVRKLTAGTLRAYKVSKIVRHVIDTRGIEVQELGKIMKMKPPAISELKNANKLSGRTSHIGPTKICLLLDYLGYRNYHRDYKTIDIILDNYIREHRL